ncbi:outer membrane protein assembly factor BamE [Oceanobacter mangrovi]|uniref:outer membrane protein assembly factor BamE n=1 Tax=Oceanobacter mangrovi TaxID=2862510 RepID=UPI001FE8BF10|nr:outer membrane protein assembly factor BamE [Oceanobacter mangrovi]
MIRPTILTFLLGIATLSGCVFPGVHKLNIQQGNIVTQDMLDQLKPGMTESQVEFVMGTPVLKNPFAEQRWDYLYTLEERDVITKQYLIQVYFDANRRFDHYSGSVPADANFTEKNQADALPEEESNGSTVPAQIAE